MRTKSTYVETWRTISTLALVWVLLILPTSVGVVQASRGTTTPEEAVSIMVRPFYDPSVADGQCNP